MKSLPTISPERYEYQSSNNDLIMMDIFKQFFPQFPAFSFPFDRAVTILSYLEETGVNPDVLPRVIRGIHNISLGTGEGEVIIHVRRGALTLETKEREGEIRTKNI